MWCVAADLVLAKDVLEHVEHVLAVQHVVAVQVEELEELGPGVVARLAHRLQRLLHQVEEVTLRRHLRESQ